MLPELNDQSTPEAISLAQWLIAESAFYTNYIHSAMYRRQMELTAELQEAQEHNERLAAANAELQERITNLTEAYATLFGDAMNLTEIKQHMPTPFHGDDPQWCAQAAAVMCRST